MIAANHEFQVRSLNALDENGNEGCARCGRPRDVHPAAPAPGRPASEQPLSDYLRERGRPGVADMIEDAERGAAPAVTATTPRKAARLTAGRIQVYIEPRDMWIGVYVAPPAVYVCPLPMLVIRWSRP